MANSGILPYDNQPSVWNSLNIAYHRYLRNGHLLWYPNLDSYIQNQLEFLFLIIFFLQIRFILSVMLFIRFLLDLIFWNARTSLGCTSFFQCKVFQWLWTFALLYPLELLLALKIAILISFWFKWVLLKF